MESNYNLAAPCNITGMCVCVCVCVCADIEIYRTPMHNFLFLEEEKKVVVKPNSLAARSFLKSNKQELLQNNNSNCNISINNNNKKRKLCDVNFFDNASTENSGDSSTSCARNNGDKTLKTVKNSKIRDDVEITRHTSPEGSNHKNGNKARLKTDDISIKKEKINFTKLSQDKNFKPMLGRGLRSEQIDFEEDFLCYDKYTGEDTSISRNSFGDDKAIADSLKTQNNNNNSKHKIPLEPSRAKVWLSY